MVDLLLDISRGIVTDLFEVAVFSLHSLSPSTADKRLLKLLVWRLWCLLYTSSVVELSPRGRLLVDARVSVYFSPKLLNFFGASRMGSLVVGEVGVSSRGGGRITMSGSV